MKVVILAGGKGSRMGSLTRETPKPMVALAGKPILEHQIDLAKRYGLSEFYLLTGYKSDVIEDYFGDGSAWGVDIRYSREDQPLGTAGAVKELEWELAEDFLLFYGDVLMDVDLHALIRLHEDRNPMATIAVHPNDHPYDSDLVEVDGNDRVIAIHNKPHATRPYRQNLVSAALYVLSPAVFKHIVRHELSDFGRDTFPEALDQKETIIAYNTREYIKDVGTMERLDEVERDLEAGRSALRNGANSLGAFFIDRDGVINTDLANQVRPEDFALLPRVADAVGRVNRSGRLAVVVTNQPAIAKGFATEDDVDAVHAKLDTLLGAERAFLDRIYYCPHHPERGHPGERPEYKMECDCRKPRTGMIERAVQELNIDLSDSLMVGDRTADILAGANAGLTTVLVRTGDAGRDGEFPCDPDLVFDDLHEAVVFAIDRYPDLEQLAARLLPSDLFSATTRPTVVIAGLSRSGKSTLAAALASCLRKRGLTSKRLLLDHFLVPVDDRTDDMTVRDRFRYADIRQAVARLQDGEVIEFDRHDSIIRGPDGSRHNLHLNDGEILVVDGVVGLDIDEVRQTATVALFTEVDEGVRKKRFEQFYLDKGLAEPAIRELYARRQSDELPIVMESRRFADHVVDLDTL